MIRNDLVTGDDEEKKAQQGGRAPSVERGATEHGIMPWFIARGDTGCCVMLGSTVLPGY